MGRIVAPVVIENLSDRTKRIETDALVDTGAYMMTLPKAWRDRLGDLPSCETVNMRTATQETIQGDICGPVHIQIPGFRKFSGEVMFVDMVPDDGRCEPLIGYITLELSQAAVDMVGQRLTRVRHLDLK